MSVDQSRKGRAVVDVIDATLTFERVLHHSPEQVWDAVATADGLTEWLMCSEVSIDGRSGGRIEMVSGPAGYRSTGAILTWDPPHVFEYEWNVEANTEMPLGMNAIFRYELRPQAKSTLLTVTYRRIRKEIAPGFLPGLHVFLDRLEAQLDGRPLPDWQTRFDDLRTEYPAWKK
jgi:uncharacterized protein YndB with AHSA1/START domain